MKTKKAIIVDDEQGSINSLIWELENFQNLVEVIATTTIPKEGIDLIKNEKPDIVFLDIEMPGMNGFELLKNVDQSTFKVIFTTAYDQFALQAFEVNAYDYLLKPVVEEELERALNKVIENDHHDETLIEIRALMSKLERGQNKSFAIPTLEGLEFIEASQIIRCVSDSNYTHIHLENSKPLLIAKTLKDVELILDDKQFYRIHNSHIINLNYLKKYLKGKDGSVVLKDGTTIPISRSRKGGFLKEI
jgi:two-component system LytT family response regulator